MCRTFINKKILISLTQNKNKLLKIGSPCRFFFAFLRNWQKFNHGLWSCRSLFTLFYDMCQTFKLFYCSLKSLLSHLKKMWFWFQSEHFFASFRFKSEQKSYPNICEKNRVFSYWCDKLWKNQIIFYVIDFLIWRYKYKKKHYYYFLKAGTKL